MTKVQELGLYDDVIYSLPVKQDLQARKSFRILCISFRSCLIVPFTPLGVGLDFE